MLYTPVVFNLFDVNKKVKNYGGVYKILSKYFETTVQTHGKVSIYIRNANTHKPGDRPKQVGTLFKYRII